MVRQRVKIFRIRYTGSPHDERSGTRHDRLAARCYRGVYAVWAQVLCAARFRPGLIIVRLLAQLNEGEVTIESVPKERTTVTVAFNRKV